MGVGGSSVSPSSDIAAVDSQSVSPCSAVAVSSPPKTAPSGSVTALNESDLLFSPGRSSDVIRILQESRERLQKSPAKEKTVSKTSKSKGNEGNK